MHAEAAGPYLCICTQKLLAAWNLAIKERGKKDSMAEVKPGVEWTALDKEGKVWGPKAVKEEIEEELREQVRADACVCVCLCAHVLVRACVCECACKYLSV